MTSERPPIEAVRNSAQSVTTLAPGCRASFCQILFRPRRRACRSSLSVALKLRSLYEYASGVNFYGFAVDEFRQLARFCLACVSFPL